MQRNKVKDSLLLLSKMDRFRLGNAVRLFISFHLSRWLKKPVFLAYPSAVSIEPTTSCNLRCPECPSGLRSFTRPTGMLHLPLFEKMIGQIQKHTFYLTLYFQGEPYLHPGFFDMVKHASDKKLYVATSTNAHYLHSENARKTVASGLSRLVISIDGTSQETYEQYRIGGSLAKVLEGAREVVEWKRKLKSATPYLIFQYLVVKPNEHQVAEAEALSREIGMDEIVFKTAQVYEFEKGSPLIPEHEKYSRYKLNEDGTYSIKNKLLNQCWRMWQSCVMTWNGRIVPCCFDKDASHVLGDVSTTPFASIWFSDEYNRFRKSILQSRAEIDICRNCTEGTAIFSDQ